jgi:REP element-mobilizing transposase RayT
MGGIIKDYKGCLLEIGGISNHVHLLISLSNLNHYSDVIRDVKAGSSLWVRKTVPGVGAKEFGWQEGYGSFCVNYSSIDSVKRYIQNQEEHHRKHTYEEEFIRFLEAHNIAYDPRFVFD